MWTPETRTLYDRSHLRYPSDVTDEEWELIKPQIAPAKRGGRKREVDEREIMNAIMYVLSTGCQWRALPKDFPPRSTVWHYLDLWSYDGTLERIHHELYVKCREKAGREASPTAAIVDSQSVKSAEKGGPKSMRLATMQEEDQGQEAAYSCRYSWFIASCHRSSSRYSRPRWWGSAAFHAIWAVPIPEKAVRRWGLSRAAIRTGRRENPAGAASGDRQAVRSSQGL